MLLVQGNVVVGVGWFFFGVFDDMVDFVLGCWYMVVGDQVFFILGDDCVVLVYCEYLIDDGCVDDVVFVEQYLLDCFCVCGLGCDFDWYWCLGVCYCCLFGVGSEVVCIGVYYECW